MGRHHESRCVAIAAAALIFCPLASLALENTPILQLDASGGQIFFNDYQGNNASDSGMGNWLLGDGLEFSSSDAVVSTLSGQYLHQAQVNQIGGGGTLVTQTLDNTASARWIDSLGDWKIKPYVSFTNALATINGEETLGDGIFDYDEDAAGVQVEWEGERVQSVRQDFSISKTDYYNYQPSDSPLFGSELLNSAQNLNFISYTYDLAADFTLWPSAILSASYGVSYLDYPDQEIPESTGWTSQTRADWMGSFALGLAQKLPPSFPIQGTVGLNAGLVILDSNQNDYDAGQSITGQYFFNPDYYSYREFSVGPTANFSIGKKWKANLSYSYALRDYRNRLAQSSSGDYLSSTIWTGTHTASCSLSYPLSRRLSLQFSGGYVYADSNTHFQNFYLYDYSYPYYFAGFGYAL